MVSCSDYDDDIDSLNNRVTAVEQTVKELQDKINAGAVITDVQTVENGVKVTLSDGSSFTLVNGKDGSAGSVVTMGSDGYWYIDGQKTENPWKGEKETKVIKVTRELVVQQHLANITYLTKMVIGM